MDLWEATSNSVNLVYIRIMRDIVRYYASARPAVSGTSSMMPATRCVSPI